MGDEILETVMDLLGARDRNYVQYLLREANGDPVAAMELYDAKEQIPTQKGPVQDTAIPPRLEAAGGTSHHHAEPAGEVRVLKPGEDILQFLKTTFTANPNSVSNLPSSTSPPPTTTTPTTTSPITITPTPVTITPPPTHPIHISPSPAAGLTKPNVNNNNPTPPIHISPSPAAGLTRPNPNNNLPLPLPLPTPITPITTPLPLPTPITSPVQTSPLVTPTSPFSSPFSDPKSGFVNPAIPAPTTVSSPTTASPLAALEKSFSSSPMASQLLHGVLEQRAWENFEQNRKEQELRAEELARYQQQNLLELQNLRLEREKLEKVHREYQLSLDEQDKNLARRIELQKQELVLERQRTEREEEENQRKIAEMDRQLLQQRAELDRQANERSSSSSSSSSSTSTSTSSSSSSPSTSSSFSSLPPPTIEKSVPRVGLFRVYPSSQEEYDDIDIIYRLFISTGVEAEDIKIFDLTVDPEMTAWVKKKIGSEKIPSPMVFIYDHPIGDLKAVSDLFSQKGKAQALLDSPPAAPSVMAEDDDLQSVGVIGAVLNASEYVGSFLTSWWRQPATPLPPGIDFQVVHQNWYFRNLYRTFRFADNAILRIHPSSMTIRASHPYDSIKYVAAIDPHNIVIYYNDGSTPDYIRASTQQIHAMKVLINEKSRGSVQIVTP